MIGNNFKNSCISLVRIERSAEMILQKVDKVNADYFEHGNHPRINSIRLLTAPEQSLYEAITSGRYRSDSRMDKIIRRPANLPRLALRQAPRVQ